MHFFVVCHFFQDKARVRKNGNAELKSRAANEIKNVLAEVAKVAEVLPFLPFLPVQIFHKERQIKLPGKEERSVFDKRLERKKHEWRNTAGTEHRCAE